MLPVMHMVLFVKVNACLPYRAKKVKWVLDTFNSAIRLGINHGASPRTFCKSYTISTHCVYELKAHASASSEHSRAAEWLQLCGINCHLAKPNLRWAGHLWRMGASRSTVAEDADLLGSCETSSWLPSDDIRRKPVQVVEESVHRQIHVNHPCFGSRGV